jgi:hypothetical protein
MSRSRRVHTRQDRMEGRRAYWPPTASRTSRCADVAGVSDTVGIRSRRQVETADWLRAARVLVTRGRSAFSQSSKQTQGQREITQDILIPLLEAPASGEEHRSFCNHASRWQSQKSLSSPMLTNEIAIAALPYICRWYRPPLRWPFNRYEKTSVSRRTVSIEAGCPYRDLLRYVSAMNSSTSSSSGHPPASTEKSVVTRIRQDQMLLVR